MTIKPFEMERFQSLWENMVDYNLSESGVHPLQVKELLDEGQLEEFLRHPIGYNQTNGTEELRSKISQLYPNAAVENVLVTNGSSEANFLSIWNLIESGDQLTLMLPNYMQIWGLANAQNAKVKPFHLIPKDGRWQIDWDEFEGAVTPQTKLIAVCNPNNPTGAQLNETDLNRICKKAADVDAWILSDEVYRGAERTGDTTHTFWGNYPKTIVVCGLSKAYGLPGLRIGWIVAPPNLVEDLWSYHDYTTICPNPLSDFLARVALSSPKREQILDRTKRIVKSNFQILDDWIRSHNGLFEYIPPQAGAISIVKYNLNMKSLDFATKLREQKSVLIVPGKHFFMEHYLRFGFGSPAEYLRQALERISEFVKKVINNL